MLERRYFRVWICDKLLRSCRVPDPRSAPIERRSREQHTISETPAKSHTHSFYHQHSSFWPVVTARLRSTTFH